MQNMSKKIFLVFKLMLKKLNVDYKLIFEKEIIPIIRNCSDVNKITNRHKFCDSFFAVYYEYKYGNDINNKINSCGKENIEKINEYCFNLFNSYRGWNEREAYMFYKMYQNLFEYMNKSINCNSKLKMILVGGHDTTISNFMNFLDGLKIIPRTHFPHYAYNILIELRKYENKFYLEFYCILANLFLAGISDSFK